MVGLLLTSTDFRGTLLCEVRDILYERISPRLQAELGLTRAAGGTDRAGRRRRSQTEARRVERAFHRLRKVMDPSIHMKGKKLTWVELSALNRVLTVDEQVEQRAALETFSNTLLAATELALDPKTRDRHDGSAGIDATPIRLWARGKSVHSEDASTDPDGGNYVRTGDHTEENSGGKKETGARRQNRIKEAFYGMDVSLMVAGDSTGGDRLYYPPIAIAVTLDRPGVDQAGAARRMIASLAERGHKPGFLAGDGLYSNSAAEAFHTPAREAGWKLVLPLGKDQFGRQATHPSGAVMVDGDWMCPAIPDENADAVKLLRERQITLAEFRTLIEQRVRYRLKVHDVTASGQVRR